MSTGAVFGAVAQLRDGVEGLLAAEFMSVDGPGLVSLLDPERTPIRNTANHPADINFGDWAEKQCPDTG